MDKKDFESLLNKYPDCVSNGKKLKAFLTDLYPDVPKAIVNTLTIMADDGIISEMQKAGQTPLVSARLQKKLEDDYGLSQKIISKCFSLIIYDNVKQTKSTINAGTYEKITSFIDTQPTFELRKEGPQKLDILQPEYNPKDFEIENGTLKKYKGSSSVVVIPDNVARIGRYAFSCCKGLTSITIGNGVTSIDNSAFWGCEGLTSIIIPNSVTSIGSDAFKNCYRLVEVYNKSTLSITADSSSNGRVAYYAKNVYTNEGGSKLTTDENGYVIYTDGDEKILVAYHGTNIELILPSYITEINRYAFSGCERITNITIPNTIASIGEDVFSGCTGLTSITIPNSVTSIGWGTFSGCTGLTSITIPDSVTSIGGSAFRGCTGLKSVTIPDSVTSIGSSAFSDTAWYNNQPNGLVYAGKVAYEYKGTMLWCTSIVLKEGTLGIGAYAFYGCERITNITIPDSVTIIGAAAFYNCTGLTSITIPDSVTSIGWSAFYGTAWYNNQPDGLVYAGKVAYKYKGTMPSNTSIVLKEGTLGIGDYAFQYCSGLTSITIPDSVTSIGWSAFWGCEGLTSITIPDSATSIGGSAFSRCSGLTSITIPDSVTSIGDDAFSGCRNLTINCEAERKPIGWSNCWNQEHSPVIWGKYNQNMFNIKEGNLIKYKGNEKVVIIPGCVNSIQDKAFYGCNLVENVTISNNVKNIGCDAFSGCTALTSITIPDSVKTIGWWAFSGCRNLTIYCEAESKPIGWSSYWNPGHRPVVWGVKK